MARCSKCFNNNYWKLTDGRVKCKRCRKVFTNKKVNKPLLRKVISEFVLGHSTDIILSRVNISKYQLLKILTLLRMRMTEDIPDIFEGIVEVDETYAGGQWKNKRKSEKIKLGKAKRGRGTFKQPLFGILCRKGKVWAKVVCGVEANDLQPLIEKQVKKGSTVCSDSWRGYTGIATRGYVHRLVKHEQQEYSDKQGHHINGLEGFWGYLKRKLAAKGGIRKEKLPIYVGEYVWRYNNRKLILKEQEMKLFKIYFNN
jgi:transposase-like protein